MDNGGPAFPIAPNPHYGKGPSAEPRGMTLRDYFAARAVPAFLAQTYEVITRTSIKSDEELVKVIADKAYLLADAMLERRWRDD